ncbi:hypothetical protein SDC9_196522 [bioreactor metagenome]|uniref:Uncharacterized protein n=1 Tax=bioreactor metagenome TaxID=1076179 RepID=A0A645IEM8_9ZZZZ
MANKANGRPISLLRLPGVLAVGPTHPMIDAVISLTVVLPQLPVTPMRRTAGYFATWALAKAWSAFNGSSTAINAMEDHEVSFSTDSRAWTGTMAATACLRAASATKALPSAFAPANATNSDPGPAWRESTTTVSIVVWRAAPVAVQEAPQMAVAWPIVNRLMVHPPLRRPWCFETTGPPV